MSIKGFRMHISTESKELLKWAEENISGEYIALCHSKKIGLNCRHHLECKKYQTIRVAGFDHADDDGAAVVHIQLLDGNLPCYFGGRQLLVKCFHPDYMDGTQVMVHTVPI